MKTCAVAVVAAGLLLGLSVPANAQDANRPKNPFRILIGAGKMDKDKLEGSDVYGNISNPDWGGFTPRVTLQYDFYRTNSRVPIVFNAYGDWAHINTFATIGDVTETVEDKRDADFGYLAIGLGARLYFNGLKPGRINNYLEAGIGMYRANSRYYNRLFNPDDGSRSFFEVRDKSTRLGGRIAFGIEIVRFLIDVSATYAGTNDDSKIGSVLNNVSVMLGYKF